MTSPLAIINDYRARILAGEEIPPEELARAVELLRTSRASTVVAKAEAKAAKAAPVDLGALFANILPKE